MNNARWSLPVRPTIGALQSKREKIRFDGNLSEEGKRAALQRVQQETQAARANAIKWLGWDVGELRAGLRDLAAKRQEEEKKAADSWDYKKLAYLGDEVKSKISQLKATRNPMLGNGVDLIAGEYQRAMDSGDRELQRVWNALAPAELLAYPDDKQATALIKTMEATLPKLLTTPQIEAIKAAESEYVARTVEVVETVQEAKAFFDGGGMSMGASPAFDSLVENVRISRKVHPENWDHYLETSVEFVDSAPSDSAGDSAPASAAASE